MLLPNTRKLSSLSSSHTMSLRIGMAQLFGGLVKLLKPNHIDLLVFSLATRSPVKLPRHSAKTTAITANESRMRAKDLWKDFRSESKSGKSCSIKLQNKICHYVLHSQENLRRWTFKKHLNCLLTQLTGLQYTRVFSSGRGKKDVKIEVLPSVEDINT